MTKVDGISDLKLEADPKGGTGSLKWNGDKDSLKETLDKIAESTKEVEEWKFAN